MKLTKNLKETKKNKLLIIIVGPTGIGKTEISIELAKRINGEIISADSLQVYQDLNIGTAKPTKEQQNEIKHYLINFYSPDRMVNAFDYSINCRKLIKQVSNNGKIPIVVGGSGLYIKAILDGLFKHQVTDKSVRDSLNKDCKKFGTDFLYEELKKADPLQLKKIHKNDKYRIMRALEVCRSTGTAISEWQKLKDNLKGFNVIMIGITMDRSELYGRINNRVDKMLESGLIGEVKNIILKYGKNIPALKGLGYKQILNYLEGKTNYEETVNSIKRDTRRYAKRQITWFKKDERIIWIERNNNIIKNVEQIIKIINKG